MAAETCSLDEPRIANVKDGNVWQIAYELIDRAAELKISDRYRIIDERPIGKFDETPLFPALAIPVETKRAFECPTEGDAEIRALRSSSS